MHLITLHLLQKFKSDRLIVCGRFTFKGHQLTLRFEPQIHVWKQTGRGCGAVGLAVAFDTRDPQIEPHHRQNFECLSTVFQYRKDENKWKREREWAIKNVWKQTQWKLHHLMAVVWWSWPFLTWLVGWICYAEKTHGNWILPYISRVKSAQQVGPIVLK